MTIIMYYYLCIKWTFIFILEIRRKLLNNFNGRYHVESPIAVKKEEAGDVDLHKTIDRFADMKKSRYSLR